VSAIATKEARIPCHHPAPIAHSLKDDLIVKNACVVLAVVENYRRTKEVFARQRLEQR